jgi:hypothetical protein
MGGHSQTRSSVPCRCLCHPFHLQSLHFLILAIVCPHYSAPPTVHVTHVAFHAHTRLPLRSRGCRHFTFAAALASSHSWPPLPRGALQLGSSLGPAWALCLNCP